MANLYPEDLKKLSFLCDQRAETADNVLKSEETSWLEKSLANQEKEYMEYLSRKLLSVLNSDSQRIAVVR